jgi:hypothetical protein
MRDDKGTRAVLAHCARYYRKRGKVVLVQTNCNLAGEPIFREVFFQRGKSATFGIRSDYSVWRYPR